MQMTPLPSPNISQELITVALPVQPSTLYVGVCCGAPPREAIDGVDGSREPPPIWGQDAKAKTKNG